MRFRPASAADQLFDRAVNGDRRALARLFTRMERDSSDLRDLMRLAYPRAGGATVIGVTGPPGAGKSTLVDGLARQARAEGKTVGVLAADPTSPFTGGAVLGDRVRMCSHFLDPDVFIRSIATRGVHGGLAAVSLAGVRLLEAVGKDLVLVETVGVGQTELDVMGVADLVLVVLVPEAGDSVQAMKAGLLEIADVFVINKADRDGAGQLASAIRSMISLDPRPAQCAPPVLMTQAHQGEGVPELYAKTSARIDSMRRSGQLADRRSRQARHEVVRLLTSYLTSALDRVLIDDDRTSDLMSDVESGELDPYSAAQQILDNGLITDALRAPRQGMGRLRGVSPGCVVGIDLVSSERRPTACAVLDSGGALVSVFKKITDADILDMVRECAPRVVAIDSPLGFPKGMDCLEECHDCRSVHPFKGRLCERELVLRGISLYLTTKRSFIKSMIYRAIALAEEIRGLGPEVIEVYPHASKVALFGKPIPKKTTAEGRVFLTQKLKALIPGLADADARLDHDLLDALVAAQTAYLHTLGLTEAFGIPEEAQIFAPASSATASNTRESS